jgi:zinc transporter
VSGDWLLLSLRGINTNPGHDPEEMVAVRAWCDGRLLITTRHRRVRAADTINGQLEAGEGPASLASLLEELSLQLALRSSEAIADLGERVDELEDELLAGTTDNIRQPAVELRREIIMLRRYLAPQRDALGRLWQERLSWLGEEQRLALREVADTVMRQVEDLDALRDRGTVVYEELSSRLADQMNQRMYLLSLIAGIFLPLGFLTGLLGINVGGIPWTDNQWGFTLVVVIVGVVGVLQWQFFKHRHWV